MAGQTVMMGGPRRRGAWLFVESRPDAGRDFRLSDRSTIGSDASNCDVILQDRSVSAQHARIQREGKTYVIHDLASTNGMWVNDNRAYKTTLHDDDRIRVGVSTLVFKITGAK